MGNAARKARKKEHVPFDRAAKTAGLVPNEPLLKEKLASGVQQRRALRKQYKAPKLYRTNSTTEGRRLPQRTAREWFSILKTNTYLDVDGHRVRSPFMNIIDKNGEHI